MKLTVPCPACRSGVIDLVRASGGWCGRCTDCRSRTAADESPQVVIQLFKRGEFAEILRR